MSERWALPGCKPVKCPKGEPSLGVFPINARKVALPGCIPNSETGDVYAGYTLMCVTVVYMPGIPMVEGMLRRGYSFSHVIPVSLLGLFPDILVQHDSL